MVSTVGEPDTALRRYRGVRAFYGVKDHVDLFVVRATSVPKLDLVSEVPVCGHDFAKLHEGSHDAMLTSTAGRLQHGR